MGVIQESPYLGTTMTKGSVTRNWHGRPLEVIVATNFF